MESKKSIQLSQAFGAVLTLVLVATLIIVAIVIFVNLSDSFAGTQTSTVTNETGGWLNQTAYPLDLGTACGAVAASVTEAWNVSSDTVIATANLTVDSAAFTVTSTDFEYNSTDVSYTYSYTWGSGACNASDAMVSEFENYTSLIGLVGTIIFLGIVIGILVASFAFGGRREV